MIITSSARISASDISPEAVALARANITRAGLEDSISLKVSDFKDVKLSKDCEFTIGFEMLKAYQKSKKLTQIDNIE